MALQAFLVAKPFESWELASSPLQQSAPGLVWEPSQQVSEGLSADASVLALPLDAPVS